jgi:hypothetical protein
MEVLTLIQEKIELWWGLILQLDPWTSIALFLIYGVIFEALYARSLYAFRDFKAVQASILSSVLFLISLWGLGEALTENIMYTIPIILGTFVGTYAQVKIEKHKSETKNRASGGTSDET